MKKNLIIIICISILFSLISFSGAGTLANPADPNQGLLANWYKINNMDAGSVGYQVDQSKRTPEDLFLLGEFERIQTGITDDNGLYITSSDLNALADQMGVIASNGDYKLFGIKYAGYITPETSGNYSFKGLLDNTFLLTIDGTPVIDFWSSKWRDNPSTPYYGKTMYLEAGKEYPIEVYYIELDGGNTFQVEWSKDGGAYSRIPESLFTKTSNEEVTITRDFTVSQKQAAGNANFVLWQSENVYADIVNITFKSASGTTIVIPGSQITAGSNLISGINSAYRPQLAQGKWTVSVTLKNVNTIARTNTNNVRFGITFNASGLTDHANANFDTGNCQEIYAGETISYDQSTGAAQFGANLLTIKELKNGTAENIFKPAGNTISGTPSAVTGLKSNWYKINNLTTDTLGAKLDDRLMTAEALFNSSDFQSLIIGKADNNGFNISSAAFNSLALDAGITANNGDYQFFGVKYYGYITPATTGNYQFKMLADNNFKIMIGGVEAISFWNKGWRDDPNNPVMGNTLYLEAEKEYYVEAYYVEDYGGNLINLQWSNDGGNTYSNIPASSFKQTNDAPVTIRRDFAVSGKQSAGTAEFFLWMSNNVDAEVVSVTFTPEYGNKIVIPGSQCGREVNGNLIHGINSAVRPTLAQGNWTVEVTLKNINTNSRPDSNNIRMGLKFYAPGLSSHANAAFDVGNCQEIYAGETYFYNESTGGVSFDIAGNMLTIKELREGTKNSTIWYPEQALPAFGDLADKLYAIEVTGKSNDIKIAMTSLQGIVNKKQPRVLVLNDSGEGNLTWPRELGIDFSYKADYLDMIYEFKNEIKGLIVYDNNLTDTINVAQSIAGVEDAIAVSPEMAALLIKAPYNLPVIIDLQGKFTTKYEAYNHLYDNYYSKMTKRIVAGMYQTGHNAHIRDMAVAVKAPILWLEPNTSADRTVLDKFYSGAIAGATYHIGWWPEEGSGVGYGTQKGVPTIPSDFYENATVYASQPKDIYTPTVPAKPALENKLYVMISVSDGDNIQYTQHVMKMKWESDPRGQIPIGWTCSPALLDAAPGILDYYYRTATDNDVLISGPSGIGYTRLQMFTSDYNTNRFFEATNNYFEKTGFNIITVWNEFKTSNNSRYSNAVNNYFPSLLGLTAQERTGSESRIRFLNQKVPLIHFADDSGLMSYDQGTDNIKNKIASAAAKQGNSPQFLAGQVVAWDVNIGAVNTMAADLLAQYPGKIEFVRPDHFMMLLNEANGNAINRALRTTATASSSDTGYSADKAVDGSIAPENGWNSSASGDKWLQIDMGSNKTISRYVVKNAGTAYMSSVYNTRNFKLQVSTDGTTWTDVDMVAGNTENIVYRNVNNVSARYVRLYITDAGTDGVARIQDFEVYAK